MNRYRIAVLPGDGIGQEVMPQGVAALKAAARKSGAFYFELDDFPWGSDYYLQTGRMMPQEALKILSDYDAI